MTANNIFEKNNAILNAINACDKALEPLTWDEITFAFAVAKMSEIPEKDQDQTEMVYIPKKGWVKQSKKAHSYKSILRDKAKHGYHNGAAWEGWSNPDRSGLDEKLAYDVKQDIKNQLQSMNDINTDISVNDMVHEMLAHINADIYLWGMNKVWYHFSHEFCSMVGWAILIEDFQVEMKEYINSTIIDMYTVVDECYPEVAFADRNKAVDILKAVLEDDLETTLKSMMDYCVNSWKEVNFPEF